MNKAYWKRIAKQLPLKLILIALILIGGHELGQYADYTLHRDFTMNRGYYGEGDYETFLKVYQQALIKQEAFPPQLNEKLAEIEFAQYFLFESQQDYERYLKFLKQLREEEKKNVKKIDWTSYQ